MTVEDTKGPIFFWGIYFSFSILTYAPSLPLSLEIFGRRIRRQLVFRWSLHSGPLSLRAIFLHARMRDWVYADTEGFNCLFCFYCIFCQCMLSSYTYVCISVHIVWRCCCWMRLPSRILIYFNWLNGYKHENCVSIYMNAFPSFIWFEQWKNYSNSS